MDSLMDLFTKGSAYGQMQGQFDQIINQQHTGAQTASILDALKTSEQNRMFSAQKQPSILEQLKADLEKTKLGNQDKQFDNEVQSNVGVPAFAASKQAELNKPVMGANDAFQKALPEIIGTAHAVPQEQRKQWLKQQFKTYGQNGDWIDAVPDDKIEPLLGKIRAQIVNVAKPPDSLKAYLQEEKLLTQELLAKQKNNTTQSIADDKNDTAIKIQEMKAQLATWTVKQKLAFAMKIAASKTGKPFKGKQEDYASYLTDLARNEPDAVKREVLMSGVDAALRNAINLKIGNTMSKPAFTINGGKLEPVPAGTNTPEPVLPNWATQKQPSSQSPAPAPGPAPKRMSLEDAKKQYGF